MWTVSDDALVAGLAAGDRDAASAFVERFQRRVYGLARSIIVDDRAAEDIAQETFVRAWKHAAAYDPRRGSVVGWLLTITRNLAIDAVRVRRPVAFDPGALLGLEQPSGDRDLAELAQLSSDTVRLRQALAKLPEEQCRAIVLVGAARVHGPRSGRDRGHSARYRQDPDPHRVDTAPDRPRERGAD